MFLRINSKPLFPPHLILRAEGADFLDSDSYVELWQMVRQYALEIEESDHLGRLNSTHVRALCIAIEACDALSQENKDFILDRLRRL